MKRKVIAFFNKQIEKDIKDLSEGKIPLTVIQLKKLFLLEKVSMLFIYQNFFSHIDLKSNLDKVIRVISAVKGFSLKDTEIMKDVLMLKSFEHEIPDYLKEIIEFGLLRLYIKPYIEDYSQFLRVDSLIGEKEDDEMSLESYYLFLRLIMRERNMDLDTLRFEAIKSGDECIKAIKIINSMGNYSAYAVEFLFVLARRAPLYIQLVAIKALGGACREDVFNNLLQLLNDKNKDVVRTTLESICGDGMKTYLEQNKNSFKILVDVVKELLNHEDDHVCFEAANVLENIGYLNSDEGELLRRMVGGDFLYEGLAKSYPKKDEIAQMVRPRILKYLYGNVSRQRLASLLIIQKLGESSSFYIGDLLEFELFLEDDYFEEWVFVKQIMDGVLNV